MRSPRRSDASAQAVGAVGAPRRISHPPPEVTAAEEALPLRHRSSRRHLFSDAAADVRGQTALLGAALVMEYLAGIAARGPSGRAA